LRDVVRWLADPSATLPPKSVAITIDEGHRPVYDVVGPIVLRERFPVTLFVHPAAISNFPGVMTWSELRELRCSGMFDVQSRAWWNPDFRAAGGRQASAAFRRPALTQFVQAREQIGRELGCTVDMLAWPFNVHDNKLIALARQAGYVAAFSIEARHVTRATQPFAMPRFPIVDALTPELLGRVLDDGPRMAGARR